MGVTSGGVPPVIHIETRDVSRTNGFQWPLHYLQIIAWSVLLILAIFYFTSIDISIQSKYLRITMRTLLIVLLAVHFVFHILAAYVNPADPSVQEKNLRELAERGGKPSFVPSFNRKLNAHVIVNQYCNLCEVKVGSKSKHCSSCNKCISNFDHHCKWLNNCVGDQNYRYFLATLITAMLCSFILSCMSMMLFIAFYTDRRGGTILKQFNDVFARLEGGNSSNEFYNKNAELLNITHYLQPDTLVRLSDFSVLQIDCSSTAWLSSVFVVFLLSLIGFLMLSHLFGFHVYINSKGLTTYEYIVRGRDKSESISKSKSRCNKITPQTSEYELTTAPYIGRPSNSKLQDYNKQGHFMINNNSGRLQPIAVDTKYDKKLNQHSDGPHSISNLSLYMETKKYPALDATPPMVRNKESFSDLDELTLDGTSMCNLEVTEEKDKSASKDINQTV